MITAIIRKNNIEYHFIKSYHNNKITYCIEKWEYINFALGGASISTFYTTKEGGNNFYRDLIYKGFKRTK